ncbi:MAG: AAA family ATPase [Pseudomonadota bacterium]
METGNVVAAKMNAHRHQWNGTICSQPQSWNCGTEPDFRTNFCDAGVPRCFHLDVFKASGPKFLTPDSSVVLAVQQQPRLFDDQVLVFYGGRFGMQQGVTPGDYEQTLFGFYRVKHASLDTARTPYRLVVEPHTESWAMFPRMHLRPSALRTIPGVAYLKQMRAKGLRDAIDEALEAAESLPKSDGWSIELQRRLQRAGDALPGWLQKAEEALAKLPPPSEAPRMSASFGNIEGPLAAKLKGFKISTAPSAPVTALAVSASAALPSSAVPSPPRKMTPPIELAFPVPEPREVIPVPMGEEDGPKNDLTGDPPADGTTTAVEAPQVTRPEGEPTTAEPLVQEPALAEEALRPISSAGEPHVAVSLVATVVEAQRDQLAVETSAEAPLVHAVPEPLGRQILEDQFGSQLVDALSVAFITKSLVILTGAPGAGKSWIASRLLDDNARDRTVIVPVASTWRGREDLLGYVNPINGSFEATEFTHFLCGAQDAWEAGDRRARLVIFEEFNLSQPEHWLSDLLVRLEYDANQLADRTVRLGGKEIASRPGRACSVVLVPNLRFAATLNNDHTVKALSPRVLDRAALIEITSSGRAALSRAGVELGDDVEDVIDELNDLLEPRGAAFSVRSARSLQRAMEAGSTNGMGLARALDLVLAQEVLSRVRLLAGDPRDEQLLSRLQAWTQKPGCAELAGCAARVADWADLLSAGRDVFQA